MSKFEVLFYEKENGAIIFQEYYIFSVMKEKNINQWLCKKTQKIPKAEIERAKAYRKDYLERMCGK